jgi:hypothetical protein
MPRGWSGGRSARNGGRRGGREIGAAVFACLLALLWHPLAGLAQNPAVTVNVDVAANRRLIDPNIYGVAHATSSQLADLNSPLNRNGGNNTTRCNWQLNAAIAATIGTTRASRMRARRPASAATASSRGRAPQTRRPC